MRKVQAFDPLAPVRKWRRHLPHWEQPGCTYFITFHTADALPERMLRVFRQARRTWLRDRPNAKVQVPKTERDLIRRVDKWLDRGRGECPLAHPEVNQLVASALLHFDGSRYALDQFAVMPNHSHSLVLPFPGFPLETILHSWKSYLSLEVNKLLGRRGALWMEESFDRIVRDWADLEVYRMYIRGNPIRAGLHPGQYYLGRGSGFE